MFYLNDVKVKYNLIYIEQKYCKYKDVIFYLWITKYELWTSKTLYLNRLIISIYNQKQKCKDKSRKEEINGSRLTPESRQRFKKKTLPIG